MTQMLTIYAGKQALQTITEKGFTPHIFTTLLGASGGPKWFVLYVLDKFLFGEFFKVSMAKLIDPPLANKIDPPHA